MLRSSAARAFPSTDCPERQRLGAVEASPQRDVYCQGESAIRSDEQPACQAAAHIAFEASGALALSGDLCV